MQNNKEKKLENIVQKIKHTDDYQQYQQSYANLMANPEALHCIELYKQAKAEYADLVLNNRSDIEKESQKKKVFAQKKAMMQYPIINKYFVSARKIELFIDDLNFDINRLMGKNRRKHGK